MAKKKKKQQLTRQIRMWKGCQMSTADLWHYWSLGEEESKRTAGEIKGGLHAETKVSTLCCVHVVRQPGSKGKGCAEQLRENRLQRLSVCVGWKGSPDD